MGRYLPIAEHGLIGDLHTVALVFETGDAYYVPPGHTPILYAGTEVVEFSPSTELQQTLEVVTEADRPRTCRP